MTSFVRNVLKYESFITLNMQSLIISNRRRYFLMCYKKQAFVCYIYLNIFIKLSYVKFNSFNKKKYLWSYDSLKLLSKFVIFEVIFFYHCFYFLYLYFYKCNFHYMFEVKINQHLDIF